MLNLKVLIIETDKLGGPFVFSETIQYYNKVYINI